MIPYTALVIVFAIAIVSTCWAAIPYDEVKLNIFDSQSRDFERNVLETTNTLNDFFARDDVSVAIAIGVVALNATPYIEFIERFVPLIRNTISSQSEWRAEFTKAIADETMNEVTDSEIRWMKSTMQTIQTKIKLLGDENPNLSNRKTVASIIHTDLDNMINFFNLKSSLFRKYPLVGAAPLIQLASLVAIISPIARTLVPMESKHPQISCKMLDVLIDYRRLAVNARLHQLHTRNPSKKSIFLPLVDVMSVPFNRNGYNLSSPGEIAHCQRDCNPKEESSYVFCLKDNFSTDEYLNLFTIHYPNKNASPLCVMEMAFYIRHRVEKLFPVDMLEKECINRLPQRPTGIVHLSYFSLFTQLTLLISLLIKFFK